jgi:tetratricopeptide (TPR) repeat protein
MRDNLFQALQVRLASFESSGEPDQLIEPQAFEDKEALRKEIGWPAFGRMPSAALVQENLDSIILAGRFCWARHSQLPDLDRLDEILEATELFVVAYPHAPGSVPVQVAGICAAINSADVDEAAGLHDNALDMLDEGLARRQLTAVDEAIRHIAAAVLAAHDDVAEPFFLTSLGSAWHERFSITGRGKDLDNAVMALGRAVARAAPPWEEAGRWANLSSVLRELFEIRGDMSKLDEAIRVGREAMVLARSASFDGETGGSGREITEAVALALRASLSSLAAALAISVEYRHDASDLDEAVDISRAVVDLTINDGPIRARHLANLANALIERFSQLWYVTDLEEAFKAANDAVTVVLSEDLARVPCLAALALTYANRFTLTRNLQDLDQAISTGRDAVARAPHGHPGRAGCQSNLGIALHRRYDHTGDSGALNEAIEMHRLAVRATPTGPRRARYLNNLGNALRARFAAATEGVVPGKTAQADAQESIAVLEKAVAMAGGDETGRSGYTANLALSLALVAERTQTPDALDRAIRTLDREILNLGDDHPVRHVYYGSLGNAWRARFDVANDRGALQHALVWFSKAADAVPDFHPGSAEYRANRGAVLLRQFELTGTEIDGHKAVAECKRVATSEVAPVFTRALAARNWGTAAARLGDATEAMDGFATAVRLLDAITWRGLIRSDQERRLGRFVALACDAAAWAISAGQPVRAVELLEQGRGVLLTHTLDDRARYHELARARRDLADELTEVDQALEQLATATDPLLHQVQSRRRAELTEQRERTLALIRELPGFEDFLKPVEFATLQAAASDGPVIVLNVSQYRCDALIVTTRGVKVVNLTTLTGSMVVARAGAFIDALRRLETEGAGQEIISATLPWLWDHIVAPLMLQLRAATSVYLNHEGSRPHIWWCPTGPLTFLPLHAAGHHDIPHETVIDQFASSYAPTLRLLKQARQPDSRRISATSLLVALPSTPGRPDLPGVDQEVAAFIELFPEAIQLFGPEATLDASRTALTGHPSLAHFACHGVQDITNPSAGHLALYDGEMTIGEISGSQLDGAELAFLSACQTFMGGAELADEAISLATAFRLAGYRHVIGTLWSISDEFAPVVAEHVYRTLMLSGESETSVRGTADALNKAVRHMRESHPDEPWFWAPYVHIGP